MQRSMPAATAKATVPGMTQAVIIHTVDVREAVLRESNPRQTVISAEEKLPTSSGSKVYDPKVSQYNILESSIRWESRIPSDFLFSVS